MAQVQDQNSQQRALLAADRLLGSGRAGLAPYPLPLAAGFLALADHWPADLNHPGSHRTCPGVEVLVAHPAGVVLEVAQGRCG
jgi:hypothetical protein